VEYSMEFDDGDDDDEDEDEDEDDSEYKGSSSCKDDHKDCEMWASMEECIENPTYMLQNCRQSCNVCQDSSDPTLRYGDSQSCNEADTDCTTLLTKMLTYMANETIHNPKNNVPLQKPAPRLRTLGLQGRVHRQSHLHGNAVCTGL